MIRIGMFTALFFVATLAPALAAEERNEGARIDLQSMGNYEGTCQDGKTNLPVTAQIVADGQGAFHGAITVECGKKGAVRWAVTGRRDGENPSIPFTGSLAAESLFPDKAGQINALQGTIENGTFHGRIGGEKGMAFSMKRAIKTSPTLGAKPPQGAIVLYAGGDPSDEWTRFPQAWQPIEDGAMQVSHSNLVSRKEFGDVQLHVEFRTPFMPDARGQARGNSGVYVQGRYEIQVLDSFGLPPSEGDCGGLYGMSVPATNASLPPTEWQTYDIAFRAPRFDANGNKTEDAAITVVHNGVTIHDNVRPSKATPGGVSDVEAAMGPILLQDHGNAVQYRNIWALPK
ncbi:MAG TPA: DUF1080 domain-containing protein [Candidatus Hydrogenedentes bacterium]|nr:DUF1080 domain-containing protein [Candidatus Hydrogenedentota bacterium]HOS02284.1 DUF1080 domain-containing protein [Candidatus Hydrogenedentota bacterium]